MDRVNELIDKLRVRVSEYFSSDASGHSVDHLERVLKYALHLQSKEGGDIIVVAIASYVHDVHRIMQNEKKCFVSPKDSLGVVSSFIEDLDITEDQKKHILYAVEHHEEYNFGSGVSVSDIESKIVQDADNLDAIGAMGIARAIRYCAAKGFPDYIVDVPLYRNEYDDAREDISAVHHIHNKLLRLGEYMNTKTAKEIAMKRNKIMEDFKNAYIDEVNGNL